LPSNRTGKTEFPDRNPGNGFPDFNMSILEEFRSNNNMMALSDQGDQPVAVKEIWEFTKDN